MYTILGCSIVTQAPSKVRQGTSRIKSGGAVRTCRTHKTMPNNLFMYPSSTQLPWCVAICKVSWAQNFSQDSKSYGFYFAKNESLRNSEIGLCFKITRNPPHERVTFTVRNQLSTRLVMHSAGNRLSISITFLCEMGCLD